MKNKISEAVGITIINDAVHNFNEWRLKFPKTIHHFDKDPNNNYFMSVIKYMGIFEVFDFAYVFS